ncbi:MULTISPECIES: SPRY domain-containing protein [Paenibacillus]|uniref:B30.2/SPRY domain-containing protein n=2 Tax=Paenibacillus TaxID=44249 RepID=A0ABX2ZCH1_PAEPO|nr:MULTISPECIES: SPRY domain-containing protein [Paenibacillus]MDR6779309.1 hypothetical protein [Paenibacillus peoriae]ODA08113.1 hypothetical protein A7312_08780 [Paenibacillus polymyxa]
MALNFKTAWDAVNKGSSSTLTNGNLTAAVPNYSGNVRATISKFTGKWYLEYKVITAGMGIFGICNANAPMNSSFSGTNNARLYYVNGVKYPENKAYGASISNGDIISILIDLDNGLLEFWRNGVSQGVSHTDILSMGTIYATVTSGTGGGSATSLATIEANFGSTAFAYSMPSGYLPYAWENIEKFLIVSDENFMSYSPSVISNATLVPKMTSNTSPTGTVEASNVWGTNYPWRAFDGISGSSGVWMASVASLPTWISYEFLNATEVTSYAIKSSTATRQPKNWTFEGYLDGQWIVLDKRDDVTDWVNGTKKTFSISESGSYKKYRLNVLLVNGDSSYLEIDEIEMYGVIDNGRIKYLSSASENDFISQGLDKSTQINLEETLKNKEYVSNNPTVFGSGKVYKQLVDPIKTPIKSILIS